MYGVLPLRYQSRFGQEEDALDRVPGKVDSSSSGTPAGAVAYDELATRLSGKAGIEPVARVSYGEHPSQCLEIFAPSGISAPRLPVVAFLHGGAWIAGGLHWLRFMAPAVTALPALFVGVTYRLAPEHRWPAQYEDAREAFRWLRLHAADYGGDVERVVAAGHSAGGQLASMVVLRGEAGAFAACMPVSAPFDLRYGDVDETSSEARVYKYLLARRSDDRDASPILFVEGNVTPFHLSWGGRDMPHIRRAGATMREALAAQQSEVTTQVYTGDDHFATHTRLADPADHWYAHVRRLLAVNHAAQPEIRTNQRSNIQAG